jgi:hypothetical protein
MLRVWEIDRRIDNAAVLLRALNQDPVRLECIGAERAVLPVPFDASEGHVNNRKGPSSGLELARAQILHLH